MSHLLVLSINYSKWGEYVLEMYPINKTTKRIFCIKIQSSTIGLIPDRMFVSKHFNDMLNSKIFPTSFEQNIYIFLA